MIKKVPFPICGVMLGTAALGNLLQSHSETVRNICGILAAFLLVLILLKLVKYPSTIKEDLDTPVMAGVAATFPMALMILSTYVKPFIGQGAYFVWIFAIVLHIILIVYFEVRIEIRSEKGLHDLVHRICRNCSCRSNCTCVWKDWIWSSDILVRPNYTNSTSRDSYQEVYSASTAGPR